MSLSTYILVAAGGAVGSLLRFSADQLSCLQPKYANTIAINLAGCLLIGILSSILHHYDNSQSTLSRFLITGLLGGFTTFSTFALQPVDLIRNGHVSEAVAYIAISVIGGLILCAAALSITDRIFSN